MLEQINELNLILKKYNLKKVDLARILNVTPQFINSVTKGKKNLSLTHLEILKEKLNLTESEVIRLKKSILIKDNDLNIYIDTLQKNADFCKTLIEDDNLKELFVKLSKIKNAGIRNEILDYIDFKLKKDLN